jgi:hypothetical protein
MLSIVIFQFYLAKDSLSELKNLRMNIIKFKKINNVLDFADSSRRNHPRYHLINSPHVLEPASSQQTRGAESNCTKNPMMKCLTLFSLRTELLLKEALYDDSIQTQAKALLCHLRTRYLLLQNLP